MKEPMRNRFLFVLIPLLVLLLLLPFTDYGQRILMSSAEPANREDFFETLPPAAPESEPEQVPVPSSVAKASDFIGEYMLISVSGDGNDISDEDLTLIRNLGIPLSLVIREDGSARLEIFDETTDLIWAGTCLFEPETLKQYLFHYDDGILRLSEGGLIFLFKKTE